MQECNYFGGNGLSALSGPKLSPTVWKLPLEPIKRNIPWIHALVTTNWMLFVGLERYLNRSMFLKKTILEPTYPRACQSVGPLICGLCWNNTDTNFPTKRNGCLLKEFTAAKEVKSTQTPLVFSWFPDSRIQNRFCPKLKGHSSSSICFHPHRVCPLSMHISPWWFLVRKNNKVVDHWWPKAQNWIWSPWSQMREQEVDLFLDMTNVAIPTVPSNLPVFVTAR